MDDKLIKKRFKIKLLAKFEENAIGMLQKVMDE
jgi:hypothetical protein